MHVLFVSVILLSGPAHCKVVHAQQMFPISSTGRGEGVVCRTVCQPSRPQGERATPAGWCGIPLRASSAAAAPAASGCHRACSKLISSTGTMDCNWQKRSGMFGAERRRRGVPAMPHGTPAALRLLRAGARLVARMNCCSSLATCSAARVLVQPERKRPQRGPHCLSVGPFPSP